MSSHSISATKRICRISSRTNWIARGIIAADLKYARNGRMRRAQEQQVEELSVQKLTENHETVQQLTSQLQQMQEQMNSMNDAGDFQDAESNYSAKWSLVSSQPVRIPSSRSLLSRDKRLPLDTWNQSGVQENVFCKSIFYV